MRTAKNIILALLSVAVLSMLACGGSRTETKLQFTENPYSASVGQSVSLKVVVVEVQESGCFLTDGEQPPPDAQSGFVAAANLVGVEMEKWSVDPAAGATIDSSGVFTADAPGTYTVTASKKEWDGECTTVVEVSGSAPTILYDNGSDAVVYNGGKPPTIEFKEATMIASIQDYHYAEGKGTAGGGTIGLKAEDGTTYGPWETETREGQGGVPNAYWTATVNVVLPPGSYTVIDSDPRTWSQNADSKGFGMTQIVGAPAE